jgi:hypothetical protein
MVDMATIEAGLRKAHWHGLRVGLPAASSTDIASATLEDIVDAMIEQGGLVLASDHSTSQLRAMEVIEALGSRAVRAETALARIEDPDPAVLDAAWDAATKASLQGVSNREAIKRALRAAVDRVQEP